MNESHHARRLRLRPGLDALEEKCLLSPAPLGHPPKLLVLVHAPGVARTEHIAKHPSQTPHADLASKLKAHPVPRVKHAPKHPVHVPKVHPKRPTLPPVAIAPPGLSPTPTPTPTAPPTPSPSPTPAPNPPPPPPPPPPPAPFPPPTPAPAPTIPLVNQDIVNFAVSQLGQKVGQGECTDLAVAAYASAGAESEAKLGPTGPDADYVWGTLVATLTTPSQSLAGILPGDVIQFRDVTLIHTTHYPDGSWYTTTKTASHHTAIVESISGTTINVLEQNVGSATTPDAIRHSVQRGTYDLADLQSGTMWVYQPISLS